MSDILKWIVAFFIIGLVRSLLPKIPIVTKKLVDWTVLSLEKKIIGSKRGAEKKAKAIKRLRWLGVKINEATSTMIDIAVEAMNAKQESSKYSLQESIENQVDVTAEKIVNTPKG